MSDSVDLRALKERAFKIGGPFANIILTQPDSISREEYLVKAGDWLRLLEAVQK